MKLSKNKNIKNHKRILMCLSLSLHSNYGSTWQVQFMCSGKGEGLCVRSYSITSILQPQRSLTLCLGLSLLTDRQHCFLRFATHTAGSISDGPRAFGRGLVLLIHECCAFHRTYAMHKTKYLSHRLYRK